MDCIFIIGRQGAFLTMKLFGIFFYSIFGILLFFQKGYSQNQQVIVVDGYFTILDSVEVFTYLEGKEIIDKVVKIDSDSAVTLLGQDGVGGIIKVNTTNSRSEHSKYFRSDENRMYKGEPSYFIEEELQENFDPNSFDFKKAKSIEIVYPLTAVQRFGSEFVTGVVVIHTK